MPLRFDFLIAKLKRSTSKPQQKVALATSRSAGASAANRNTFADTAVSLATIEAPTLKRRKAG